MEKTWFLESINKKTMKKRSFCERFFKTAPTGRRPVYQSQDDGRCVIV
jgi:hypothetical protein